MSRQSIREQIYAQISDPYVANRVAEAVESAFWGSKNFPIKAEIINGKSYTMYDLFKQRKEVKVKVIAEEMPHGQKHTFITTLWAIGNKWKGSTRKIGETDK